MNTDKPARCGAASNIRDAALPEISYKHDFANPSPTPAAPQFLPWQRGMSVAHPSPASAESDSLVERAYGRLAACADEASRTSATAQLILAIFDDFYSLLCEYPYRAKCAFELLDTHASIRISKERLGLYSRYIAEHGPRVLAAFPALAHDAGIWDAVDRLFVAMIVDRYEADTAFSFAHSLRRNICHDCGGRSAYSFPPPSKLRAFSMASVHRRMPVQSRVDVELVAAFLRVPGFSVPFRDLKADSQRVVEQAR